MITIALFAGRIMSAVVTRLEPTIASQAFAEDRRVVPWLTRWSMSPEAKRRCLASAASTAIHLVMLGLASLIGFSLPEHRELPLLDSVWSADVTPVEFLPVAEAEQQVTIVEQPNFFPGGRAVDGDPQGDGGRAAEVAPIGRSDVSLTTMLASHSRWTAGDLTAAVGTPKKSTGSGRGKGDGVGDGEGFFGIPTLSAQRIVYVVDNSLSMNHPHDSPAKTRFKRLKIELVNSIWRMDAEQQFYVIFFNRDSMPMPARSMQRATPEAKEYYLTWVAEAKASGAPTDPRQAMEMAMSFQPDVIYFLTDGEFDKGVNRRLLQIRQPRTAIHTFAFGDKLGEAVLSEIAKNNQGKYTYIP